MKKILCMPTKVAEMLEALVQMFTYLYNITRCVCLLNFLNFAPNYY